MNDPTLPPMLNPIADTQSERDERHLAIQHVGVRDLRYPIRLRLGEAAGGDLTTPATWSLDVALPADRKGTHMSRFVQWLDAQTEPLDAVRLRTGMADMLQRLHATEGRIEARFTFFVRKQAPVSGVSSLLDYQGAWIVDALEGGRTDVWAEVVVPVKSLCPCSKEISDYGAHNQRSHVTIRAEVREGAASAIDLTRLVRLAEESASSEIWGLLKRPDEKWITERAYENPKFVEDLVRDVALRLNTEPGIGRYRVTVENFESIHNHSAFAVIRRGS